MSVARKEILLLEHRRRRQEDVGALRGVGEELVDAHAEVQLRQLAHRAQGVGHLVDEIRPHEHRRRDGRVGGGLQRLRQLAHGTVRTDTVRRSRATGLCMMAHGQLPKFTPPPGTPTLPVRMPQRRDEAIRLRAARVLLQPSMPCKIVAGRVLA